MGHTDASWPAVFGSVVTADEQAENTSESSPEFMRMVEQAPVGIAVFRGPLLIAELANEQYLALIKRKKEEFVNKPLFESLPEVRTSIEGILDNLLQTGEPFKASDFHVPLMRNGQIESAYFNFIYQPMSNSRQEIDGFMVVVTEVTDSFLARHQLKESEARFKKMVMDSPIPMTIFRGPEHIVEMANRQMFENIWRREESEVLGKRIDDAFPELRNQKYMELLDHVYQQGIVHTEKESVAFVEGSTGMRRFYLDFEYAALKDHEKKVYGIMVTVNDVTDKVKAREAIWESEQHFRSVANSAPVMIWISDPSGRFEYFNTAALDFLGNKTGSISFENWLSFIHPDERAIYEDAYKKALNNRHSFSIEMRLRDYQNTYRWISSRSVVRLDKHGDFLGFIHAGTDIHERVSFNLALHEEEARRKVMLEASELGTWELDLLTNTITCSPKFFSIFQLGETRSYTHRELIDCIHPEDADIRKEAFKRAFEKGRLEYSSRIITPSGNIRWIEVKGVLVNNEKQEPAKLIGTVRDITDARNYEHILKESERKFRMLADAIPQFVWTTDAEGIFNYFNKATIEETGLSETELIRRSFLHLQTHPEDREVHLQKWQRSLESGMEFISEHRFLNKSGQYRWMLSRAIPQRDNDKNIYLWVGTSSDIQEHKMFEQELKHQVQERTNELHTLNMALQKSEARYHLMVNEVQEYAIIYMNKDGIIENWNKGAENIKGYTAEEIIGKSFSLFYTDQDRARQLPQQLLALAAESGKAKHEGVRVKKDGSLFWADVLITAIRDQNRNIIGFSKVTHDLTKRKEADDQIRIQAELLFQKNEELEKMNTELQSFAYVSSHDLQEPLRKKFQIFAGRIIEKELNNLSDKGRSYFERMQLSAARMQKLIQDLLIYSRANNNEQAFTNCDLNLILQDVLKEFPGYHYREKHPFQF
ncbi:MAG: PAS domain S-box protein [Chitinophagaceae bacterium]